MRHSQRYIWCENEPLLAIIFLSQISFLLHPFLAGKSPHIPSLRFNKSQWWMCSTWLFACAGNFVQLAEAWAGLRSIVWIRQVAPILEVIERNYKYAYLSRYSYYNFEFSQDWTKSLILLKSNKNHSEDSCSIGICSWNVSNFFCFISRDLVILFNLEIIQNWIKDTMMDTDIGQQRILLCQYKYVATFN